MPRRPSPTTATESTAAIIIGYVRPYVVQRPVVVHEYYRPRPVIVREYYQPAPQPAVVYRTSHPDAGAAILFGALLGAVVAHQIATH